MDIQCMFPIFMYGYGTERWSPQSREMIIEQIFKVFFLHKMRAILTSRSKLESHVPSEIKLS